MKGLKYFPTLGHPVVEDLVNTEALESEVFELVDVRGKGLKGPEHPPTCSTRFYALRIATVALSTCLNLGYLDSQGRTPNGPVFKCTL